MEQHGENLYFEKFFKSIRSFCAYQERTILEVRQKLQSFKLSDNHIEKMILELVKEDFINEERFAKTFVTSKFRIKKWGKRKIMYTLQQKQVPEIFIEIGLNEIDEEEYLQAIRDLIKKKRKESKEPDNFALQYKVSNYLISKGFESDVVWKVLNYNH